MKPYRTMRSLKFAQRGTSLLEVLISLLILAVGLIGMAGLQLTALKANQSASERSAAILQTYTIASVLQADREHARGYSVTLNGTKTGTTFLDKAVTSWKDNLNTEIGGKGAINCDNAHCLITIQWDDSRGDASNSEDAQTYSLATQIPL